MYIELHASSAFSFVEAASLPEALIDRAAALGYSALALVDRDGLHGAPRFHRAARAAGLRALVGCELTLQTGDGEAADSDDAQPGAAQSYWRLPVLVESQRGYRNLCRLVSRMKLRSPKGEGALRLSEIERHAEGLVALVGRAALVGECHGVGGLVDRLVGVFGRSNLFVELQRHHLRDQEYDNRHSCLWRRRSTCRSWPPTVYVSRSRSIGRCTTCSLAFGMARPSSVPGDIYRATPNGI